MEHFIDSLSKQLTKTTSRRSMLSLASRTLFASFVTSTGIGRLWGSSTTTLSSTQVCPSCGTCRQCNTKAGKCGQDCEDPCTAAVLCSLAQQFPPYVTLQSFLTAQFTSASVPEALVLVEPSVAQSKVLSTAYTGSDPSITANLYFTEASAGFNAYAVTYTNGAPQFGYFVTPSGQLQQVIPPYELSATAVVTSPPTGIGAISLQANISQAPTQNGKIGAACKTLCGMVCEQAVAEATQCLELVIANCALSGPGYLECALVGGALCLAGGAAACAILCAAFTSGLGAQANIQTTATFQNGATCPFPHGQPCGALRCGTCQTCSNGACIPIICPSGYSCSSTTGTCSCDNFCGTTCCSSGQTCSNGQCVAPTGCAACTSSQVCCADYRSSTGYNCFPAGTICCAGIGVACNPGALGNPQCCLQTCCYGATMCCQDSNYGWCCPTASRCGTANQCLAL